MRFFGPNLPKKGSYFQSKTDKIYTTIEFLHIQISLCIKFHFEHVFKHFEDLKNIIMLDILKKKWLCLASWALFILKLYKAFQTTVQIAMIKFRSKFQFQIPLQFYRTVEKVETCDGSGQRF